MAEQTTDAQKPGMIGVTLFLERDSPIDYAGMIERIGGGLGLDANAATHQKPDDPMVLPVDGDIAFGMRMNFPYPDVRALQQLTQFAFW